MLAAYAVPFLFLAILSEACNIYLAPSLVPGIGYGVFSGIRIAKSTRLEIASTVVFENMLMQELQLLKFAYGSDIKEYSVCVFGSLMMMNHRNDPNIYRTWSAPTAANSQNNFRAVYTRPYSIYRSMDVISSRSIDVGEEMFSSYGGEHWFDERNVPYNGQVNDDLPQYQYDLSTLQKIGICMSDLYVGESEIPMAGKGVFARRSFRRGDLVSVSPVLILQREMVLRAETSSVLLNYCISSDESQLLTLPIGTVGMCNHGGRYDSSVQVRWFDWDSHDHTNKSRWTRTPSFPFDGVTAESLLNASNAPLYLGYYAVRDIARGEELTIDYGRAWEEQWSLYLNVLEEWLSSTRSRLEAGGDYGEVERVHAQAPQFRYPIGVPSDDFFPGRVFAAPADTPCEFSGQTTTSASCVDRMLNSRISHGLTLDTLKLWKDMYTGSGGSNTCNVE